MKKTTKFWLGVSAVGGGIWAWMKYGDKARAVQIAASRMVPPGYSTATNTFDEKKRPGVLYVYPIGINLGGFVQKTSRTLFVPADQSQPGVWGEVR